MAKRQPLVTVDALPQPVAAHAHVIERGDEQKGPWLTMAEASERLRYKSRNAIYEFIKRKGIVRRRRGRQWLVAKRDIDAALGA